MGILWILIPFLALLVLFFVMAMAFQKGEVRSRRNDSGSDGATYGGYSDNDCRHDSGGWWGDGGCSDAGGGDGGGGGGGD